MDGFQIDAFFGHFVERRKIAKPFHRFNHAFRHVIHFFVRVETADSKSNAGVRQVFADAERF